MPAGPKSVSFETTVAVTPYSGPKRAEFDQLLAQRVARIRRGDAVERAVGPACAEQAVGRGTGTGACAGAVRPPPLQGEQLGREQPFEQVVVPEVALGPGQPEHTGDGVGLKHGAHDVLRHPDQSVVAPCAGPKSSADSAPAARIRCSTWTA